MYVLVLSIASQIHVPRRAGHLYLPFPAAARMYLGVQHTCILARGQPETAAVLVLWSSTCTLGRTGYMYLALGRAGYMYPGARGTCTLARGVHVPLGRARPKKKQNRKRVCNFVFCSPGTCMYLALRSSPRRGKSRYGHVPSRRGASTFLRSPPPLRRVHVPSLVFG